MSQAFDAVRVAEAQLFDLPQILTLTADNYSRVQDLPPADKRLTVADAVQLRKHWEAVAAVAKAAGNKAVKKSASALATQWEAFQGKLESLLKEEVNGPFKPPTKSKIALSWAHTSPAQSGDGPDGEHLTAAQIEQRTVNLLIDQAQKWRDVKGLSEVMRKGIDRVLRALKPKRVLPAPAVAAASSSTAAAAPVPPIPSPRAVIRELRKLVALHAYERMGIGVNQANSLQLYRLCSQACHALGGAFSSTSGEAVDPNPDVHVRGYTLSLNVIPCFDKFAEMLAEPRSHAPEKLKKMWQHKGMMAQPLPKLTTPTSVDTNAFDSAALSEDTVAKITIDARNTLHALIEQRRGEFSPCFTHVLSALQELHDSLQCFTNTRLVFMHIRVVLEVITVQLMLNEYSMDASALDIKQLNEDILEIVMAEDDENEKAEDEEESKQDAPAAAQGAASQTTAVSSSAATCTAAATAAASPAPGMRHIPLGRHRVQFTCLEWCKDNHMVWRLLHLVWNHAAEVRVETPVATAFLLDLANMAAKWNGSVSRAQTNFRAHVKQVLLNYQQHPNTSSLLWQPNADGSTSDGDDENEALFVRQQMHYQRAYIRELEQYTVNNDPNPQWTYEMLPFALERLVDIVKDVCLNAQRDKMLKCYHVATPPPSPSA